MENEDEKSMPQEQKPSSVDAAVVVQSDTPEEKPAETKTDEVDSNVVPESEVNTTTSDAAEVKADNDQEEKQETEIKSEVEKKDPEKPVTESTTEDVVDDSAVPKLKSDMATLFILDLMRQKKEKVMRKKKDELINEMALQKKKQIEEARRGKRAPRSNFGGFVGVNALLNNPNASTIKKKVHHKVEEEEATVGTIPPPDRTDLLIMGMIRDEKEKKFHEAHQVMAEQAGVPSDERCRAKFEE